MTLLVQPRLVNDPFSDAGLLLDFRFGGRAILFDLGDISSLSPRELLRISHVFVSHMHMDHFAGFDHLLRLSLYRGKNVNIVGPPGLVDAVDAKLRAYTWNLLDEASPDFSIRALDWTESGFTGCALFSARSKFARQAMDPPQEQRAEKWTPVFDKDAAKTKSLRHRTGSEIESDSVADVGLLLDEPEFHIEAATLDHGIPCLAFALQEKVRINVHKARLDELGLPVGPWLTQAKRAARQDADPSTPFSPAAGRTISLGELLAAEAFKRAPGQRIAYATDFAFSAANVSSVVALASGADELFIEAGFLEEDHALAASKMHLTAAQAGRIAGCAGVGRAFPMHFSPRYLGREAELRDEFERGFAGLPATSAAGTPARLGGSESMFTTKPQESTMATNIKDAKTAKSSKGSHGGNRAGNQDKRDEQPKKSSQAAGKDPNRGKD